jgi:aldose 1-epimerase
MFKNSEKMTKGGLRIVSLSVDNENKNMEIWVFPSMGMNLCLFTINGKNKIDFDETCSKGSFYGTPLLYPTPNRVRDGVFTYKGKEYPQIKRGKRVLIHGLVRDETFSNISVNQDGNRIWVEGSIDFIPGSTVFEAFPFMHRFNVRYCLDENGLTFEYEINNYSDQCIPYGIALHPFFQRIDGDENTLIYVPFRKIYRNYENTLIPTGSESIITKS